MQPIADKPGWGGTPSTITLVSGGDGGAGVRTDDQQVLGGHSLVSAVSLPLCLTEPLH